MRISRSIRIIIATGLLCVLQSIPCTAKLIITGLVYAQNQSLPAKDQTDDNKPAQDTVDKDNKGERTDKEHSPNKPDSAGDSDQQAKKRDQTWGKVLPPEAIIIVDDRPLNGPFSQPQQRGSRIFLPVVSIARALGDEIRVDPVSKVVEVHRQTGVVADFMAQINQVRENGAAILVVSNTADILFPPNNDELMLPAEIVAALLDVSIILSETAKAVRITRSQSQASSVRDGAQHAAWELYQIDYTYNVNLYSYSFNHNALIHSTGRIGDGRFILSTNFDGGAGQEPLTFRSGNFTLDRPNKQRFIAGDFGTGTDLEFMSSSIRGLWVQQPYGGIQIKMFAGRAISGGVPSEFRPEQPPPDEVLEHPRRRRQVFDSNIIGSYASFGPSVNNPNQSRFLIFSSGLMYFDGPNTGGELATGSVKYNSERHQFLADAGAGTFSGLDLQGRRTEGFAAMLDVSELINLSENFALRGRYTHVGQNYLSPQSSGLFPPMNLVSGGFSWRLSKWFSASLNGVSRGRLDLNQSDSSVTTTISVTPRGPLPTILFTHTHSTNTLSGSSSYTLIHATKELDRWRLFSNFTRVRIGPIPVKQGARGAAETPPSENLLVGAMVKIKDAHSLQFSQSYGSGNSLGGTVDWMTTSFFTKRISFGAGFGYSYSSSKITTTERVIASMELPRRQAFQFTYAHTSTGPQLLMQLRGPLLLSRRAETAATLSLSDIKSLGAFYGRIYQDINLNGQFDIGVDRPQENVQVRVDGNYYAISDRDGVFRVDNVRVGEHEIYMDLLSVRADLTLLDSPRQVAVLRPGRDAIIDFRLVRTGRIKGAVWLDLDGNGKFDEGEQPLSDVRVLTGSGRDTLTDGLGEFGLADLPPGNHFVLVDEKTLPENTRSTTGPLQILVKAGGETDGVNFPIAPKPAEINVKRFPPSAP